MMTEPERFPSGPGYSSETEPKVSALRASIPNADWQLSPDILDIWERTRFGIGVQRIYGA